MPERPSRYGRSDVGAPGWKHAGVKTSPAALTPYGPHCHSPAGGPEPVTAYTAGDSQTSDASESNAAIVRSMADRYNATLSLGRPSDGAQSGSRRTPGKIT
jgi:hypothetical protein